MPGKWGDNKSWFFLGEFNHKNATTTNPSSTRESRVFISLRRENQGDPLRFQLGAQDTDSSGGYRGQWSRISTADLPLNEWFKLEFYLKEGGNSNAGSAAGRVFVAMIRKNSMGQNVKTVLFNITGPTKAHIPNNANRGYTSFSGLKMCTNKPIIDYVTQSGTPVTVFWDNYRLYYGTYPWYMGPGSYVGNLPAAVPPLTWQP